MLTDSSLKLLGTGVIKTIFNTHIVIVLVTEKCYLVLWVECNFLTFPEQLQKESTSKEISQNPC